MRSVGALMLTDGYGWRTWVPVATLRSTPPLARSPLEGGVMLVLTRKTNQSIMIGDDVEVSVLAVSRDKIRLGITAPREIPVFRKEVYLSIKGEGGGGDGDVRGKVDKALKTLSGSD